MFYCITQGPGSACFPAQIDLTLLTSQSAVSVRSLVERFADHLDLQHLKKISGVCMSDPERLVSAECDSGITEGDGVGLSQITSSPTELGTVPLHTVLAEYKMIVYNTSYSQRRYDTVTRLIHSISSCCYL